VQSSMIWLWQRKLSAGPAITKNDMRSNGRPF
jgi:hypothetical protein